MPSKSPQSWLAGVERILNAKSRDLRELAQLAGLDPRTMYVGTKLDGADLRGQDLRGMTFTHLDRSKVQTDSATVLDGDEPESTDQAGEALVLFLSDEFQSDFMKRAGELPGRIVGFGADEAAAYWAACETFAGPKLVVALVRHRIAFPPLLESWRDDRGAVLIVAVEAPSRQIARSLNEAPKEIPPSTIIVPRMGDGFARWNNTFPGSVREVVGLAMSFWPELSGHVFAQQLSTYISARGYVNDRDDAWYQLCGRAAKLGVLLYESPGFRLSKRDGLGPGATLLPPLHDLLVPPSDRWFRSEAALLLGSRPAYENDLEGDYEEVATRIVRHNRWTVDSNGPSETSRRGVDIQISHQGRMVDIQTTVRYPTSGDTVGSAFVMRADRIREVLVSEAADPKNILDLLARQNVLMLNLQDLRWLSPRAPTFWPVIGHQARRIARSPGGFPRSLYIASLIRTAYESGRFHLSEGDQLLLDLSAADFGRAERFEMKTAGFDDERVVFDIVLSDVFQNPAPLKFVLGVDAAGPFVAPPHGLGRTNLLLDPDVWDRLASPVRPERFA